MGKLTIRWWFFHSYVQLPEGIHKSARPNTHCRLQVFLTNIHVIGLVEGNIYRKPWFLPSNVGFSCNFSLQPIHWPWENCLELPRSLHRDRPPGPQGLLSELYPRHADRPREAMDSSDRRGSGRGDRSLRKDDWLVVTGTWILFSHTFGIINPLE